MNGEWDNGAHGSGVDGGRITGRLNDDRPNGGEGGKPNGDGDEGGKPNGDGDETGESNGDGDEAGPNAPE